MLGFFQAILRTSASKIGSKEQRTLVVSYFLETNGRSRQAAIGY